MTEPARRGQGNLGNYQDDRGAAELPAVPVVLRHPRRPRRWRCRCWRLPGGSSADRGAGSRSRSSGIALILAPVAFQMFTRAPHGAQMMSAFKDIETTQNVERIQGYFSTMAVGQGAIRNDIVPALGTPG